MDAFYILNLDAYLWNSFTLDIVFKIVHIHMNRSLLAHMTMLPTIPTAWMMLQFIIHRKCCLSV